MTPDALVSADDVATLAAALFGDDPRGAAPAGHQDVGRVLHVTALYQPPHGDARTLRIGPDSPKSAHDYFALQLARARADAIVVTGKVLRDEPTLGYALTGPARAGDALRAFRRERAGRQEHPWLCVLTSGDGFDDDHPALHSDVRPLILTTDAGRARLAHSRHEVVALPALSVRTAVAWLRDTRRARCVSIEAGPSTSRALYDEPSLVDELLLSLYLGEAPPPHVIGEPLLPIARVRTLLPRSSAGSDVQEPSGPWRFQRFWR